MYQRLNLLRRYPTLRCTIRRFATHFPFTDEQLEVIKWSRTHNLIVSARPGTGKTTAAEGIMAACPDEPTLYVTFSRALRDKADERIKETTGPMSPHSVYTLHQLAGKVFGITVPNDITLQQLLYRGIIPDIIFPWERIIVDEAQDLTPLLFRLLCLVNKKIGHGSTRQPKIILIGDPKQAIYSFRGADHRYLTYGQDIFSTMSGHPWIKLDLTLCQRFAQSTASFINEYIGEPYIQGHARGGEAPIYIHTDVKRPKALGDRLVKLIKKHGAGNSAIIVPSIRDRNLRLWSLINFLSEEHHIPIATTDREWGSSDPDTLRGKLLLSSYHGMKGDQRALVVVLGADASYYEVYGSDYDFDQCPPPVFVAVTRPIEQLVVVQSEHSTAMPFSSWEGIQRTAKLINLTNDDPLPPSTPIRTSRTFKWPIPAEKLLRHLPEIDLHDAAQLLTIKRYKGGLPPIIIPAKVKTITDKDGIDHYEPVHDLNEMAMVAHFEYYATKKCTLPTGATRQQPSIPDDPKAATRWFAKAAAKYNTKRSRYKYRLNQLQPTSFNWLEDSLVRTEERLRRKFGHSLTLRLLEFKTRLEGTVFLPDEAKLTGSYDRDFIGVSGRVDVVESGIKEGDRPTLWSLKFVHSLSLVDALELAIHGYLFCQANHQFPRLILYNIQDGEQWEISGTFQGTREMLQKLLIAKSRHRVKLTDEEFLEQCRDAIEEVDDQFLQHTAGKGQT